MKFGKQIQSQQISGWSEYYLDYKALKKIVSSLSKKNNTELTAFDLESTSLQEPKKPVPEVRALWESSGEITQHAGPPLLSAVGNEDERGPVYQKHKALFFFRLERELEKINTFYLQKEVELKLRLDTLLSKRQAAAFRIVPSGTTQATVNDHVEWRAVEEGFRLLLKDLDKLQQFIEINATGFRKILKKWDKRSKSTTKELYLARQVEVQPVFDRKLIAEISDVTASCLLDLTNIAVGPQVASSNASETVLRRQLALESSTQMHAFHDLERSLQTAVSTNDESLVKESISRAALLLGENNSKTQTSRILWKAAIEASPLIADLIISSPPFDFYFVDDINGRTCLHEAAISGETRLINLCIGQKVQVSRQDAYGRTALHYAAMFGHADACAVLLQGGISSQTVDLDNHTSLAYAIINGSADCVNLMLADQEHLQGQLYNFNPLTLACQSGQELIAKILIKAGVKSTPNTNGEYPIHLAARQGLNEICTLLSDHLGFDLPDKYYEWTPLFHASRFGHDSCIKVLLQLGAQPDRKDELGRTPAFYAAWYGHHNALTLLLPPSSSSSTCEIDLPHRALAGVVSISPLSDMAVSQADEIDLIPSLSLPPPIMPFRVYGHNYLRGTSLVQITLGHPSSDEYALPKTPAIRLVDSIVGSGNNIQSNSLPSMKLVVTCTSNAMEAPHSVALPLVSGEPVDFAFQIPTVDKLFLEFSLYPVIGSKIIGRSVLLPSAFRRIKCRGHYVAPLLDHHLEVIGEVAFEMCAISPFDEATLDIGGAIETYWKSSAVPPSGIVQKIQPDRPKLSGSPPSTYLGNPVPLPSDACISSSSLNGEYLHVVVQVTSDLVPVIYPDWHIPSLDVTVGVADVSKEQFQRLTGHSNSSPSASALKRTMKMAESCSTLTDMLQLLPPDLGLFVELAYPSSAMKELLCLGHTLKLNQFVDSVLMAVYGSSQWLREDKIRRRLVFSSYHPDVCAALNWKQPNSAVMFATPVGLPGDSTSRMPLRYCRNDDRCSSVTRAISFAKSNNLLGICVPVEILLQVPSLVHGIKDSGLMLTSQGSEEQHRQLDELLRSGATGMDGSMYDGKVLFMDSAAKLSTESRPL